jgi:molybdopterin-binding protein
MGFFHAQVPAATKAALPTVERMNLKEGDNVFTVMKATSVSVGKQ